MRSLELSNIEGNVGLPIPEWLLDKTQSYVTKDFASLTTTFPAQDSPIETLRTREPVSHMEQVTGIPGSLPPLAQFPQSSIRLGILPEEWQACLDAWIFAAEFRLRLIPEHFCHFKLSSKASGLPFLQAYLQSWGHETDKGEVYRPHDQKSLRLHRQCFILLRRLLLETDPPFDCTSGELFSILANGSATFGENLPWKETLRTVWKRDDGRISDALEAYKSSLIQNLPQAVSFSAATQIKLFQVTALVKGLPEAGAVFMTGSDYLDSLITGYTSIETLAKTSAKTNKQRELTANLYVCLSSLMRIVPPHASLMLDHLYSLKGAAELGSTSSPNVATALSSLVCSTSFLRHLDIFLASNEQKRGKTLLTALQKYREQSSHLHVLAVKKISRVQKGKEKAIQNGSIHIHQASQVSQVHDLFPDLSSQHILRLLDHFSNDVESVIAALLEPDSLPPDLQASSDTSSAQPSFQARIQDLAPHPPQSSLPQRRNVFDGDDFDSLQISSSKVHIGRKDLTRTPPTDQNEHAKSKAAIMAALAAFDSDDDERDDTYDVGDVGGTVDDTLDTDTRSQVQKPSTGRDDTFEELLFGAWRNAPEVFARDSKTRLSQPRRKLKEETGMGDEQIEGWAVMLGRDTATMTRLEKKYSLAFAFGGSQHRLAGTKWSVSRSGTATEDDDSGDDGGGQGSGIGRGSSGPLVRGGRGFGRGRGNTAGPTHAASTQAARRRKEQGRGRGGANHNRREGRAKKIGRGMTGPVA